MMKTLPEILEEAKSELAEIIKKQEELKKLESRKKALTQITEAIVGLHSTEEKMKKRSREGYDPGKNDVAYYYVESMAEKIIRTTEDFKPCMTTRCPDCGSEAPVIMSYTQTSDSPDGDWWQKRVFYICCGKLTVLKTIGDESRF